MARRLLYTAVSMVFGGCIVPTPLQQAEQTPNYRPTIVSSLVKPPLGQLIRSSTDSEDFDIVAEDPNLGDTLKARLFKFDSTRPRDFFANEVKLDFPAVPDAANPTRRTGRFASLSDCNVLGRSGTTTSLFVVVADRDFSPDPDKASTAPGGLTDEKYWDLICP